uniref:AB hydrolase-1 domain-containing protein n=1 Tax=Noccaea caerulescens TaxID=107243 RepID=A0A1J3GE86_NOCCA
MEEMRRGVPTWQDELASLMDGGLQYDDGSPIDLTADSELRSKSSGFGSVDGSGSGSEPVESLKDQVTGFMKSWGEMLLDLAIGCKDVVQQNLVSEDSVVVRKLRKPAAKVSKKLSFLNEYLPEDRDPIHAWPVIVFVFLLALTALSFSSDHDRSIPVLKKIRVHPPNASRVQLPDGRYLAYEERGVSADRARYSLIVPHCFLSSRLAGIPGVKESLLKDYGVRLVSYDLPGFGESDPHRARNLSSSASDMIDLAAALGIVDKFWLLGYSSGSMHAWAAMRYFPDRIAGVAMVAPMINPYEPSMNKEEMAKTWEQWPRKRKFIYFLARQWPSLLPFFYRRSFLSGNLEPLDQWMSISLGEKDKHVITDPVFEEHYQRNVEESVRQGTAKPFIEEAVLHVSNWGFYLAEFRMQKKCKTNGVLSWLMSMYSESECELIGFQKPLHIWQGMDDRVAPPSMTDYIGRVIPEATVHRLPNEGHFSYLYFCDECHKQIFSTLFGEPQGPIELSEQRTEIHNPDQPETGLSNTSTTKE